MKYNKEVFRNITLINQLAIHMLTPIFMCVALGVFIDNKFSTWLTLPLLIIGILAGGRNAYMLAVAASKQGAKDGSKDGDKEKDKD